jgi:hypothetical protein
VLFYVLIVYKCVLPPGDNLIAVNKCIISYKHRTDFIQKLEGGVIDWSVRYNIWDGQRPKVPSSKLCPRIGLEGLMDTIVVLG